MLIMFCNCSLGTLQKTVIVGFDYKPNEWFVEDCSEAIWPPKCQLLSVSYMYLCIKCDIQQVFIKQHLQIIISFSLSFCFKIRFIFSFSFL